MLHKLLILHPSGHMLGVHMWEKLNSNANGTKNLVNPAYKYIFSCVNICVNAYDNYKGLDGLIIIRGYG